MNQNSTREPVVVARAAVKTYGPTTALAGVTLDILPGEVRGVVGHNGAGKSTLMRAIAGVEALDSGTVTVAGQSKSSAGGFTGVRMAFQETSLAGELTVAQNIYLSSRELFPGFSWRSAARAAIAKRLAEIFPTNTISPDDYVDDITLAGRQMVEIARATLTPELKVLILDEPTESLTSESAADLYHYVRAIASRGVAVILISHRLGEVLSASDTVTVLKDGAAVETIPTDGLTERDLFLAMGGEEVDESARQKLQSAATTTVALRIPIVGVDGAPTQIVVHEGEVVGLAGIAGQGQEEVLENIWRRKGDAEVSARCSYVPGDRQRFGIFPLWNVADNLTISSISQNARFGVRRRSAENSIVTRWVADLKIKGGGSALMTGLSGGNQQKAIVARAFASDAKIVLLNDPFRGVDVSTKEELYALIRREAATGRSVVWYSSENTEMQHCDRAYVLRAGRLAGELVGANIDDPQIIALSFAATKEAS